VLSQQLVLWRASRVQRDHSNRTRQIVQFFDTIVSSLQPQPATSDSNERALESFVSSAHFVSHSLIVTVCKEIAIQ
jgi:hypothetical protein